ncbi:MAG: type II secretion system F family protein [Desulfobacterales bacterium]
MNLIVVGISIFILSVIIIELSVYGYKNMKATDRSKIRKKLRAYSYSSQHEESTDILRKRVLSSDPLIDKMLQYIPGMQTIDKLIVQANAPYQAGFVLFFSLLVCVVGFTVSFVFFRMYWISILVSLLVGTLPFFHLLLLKQKRIEKFKRQFPEALELVSRSLKAGHAFTSGFNIAADEFDDPLGPEFSETLDEINFGVSVSDALKNLSNRIDCSEIRHFTIAVNLQRETGGNLSEILESLSHLIRENFKFQGKVKVLAAEGKLSAIILTLLPILVGAYLWITNPHYLDKLFYEPVGRILLGSAIGLMILGVIVMKKIITIKV